LSCALTTLGQSRILRLWLTKRHRRQTDEFGWVCVSRRYNSGIVGHGR